MSTQRGDLSALVALIANATKVVESHFAQSSKPYVPSLDDTEPHPLDTLSNMELRNAIQTIEGACAQLCATVTRPCHTIVNKSMAIYEPNCLNVAVDFKVADILKGKPGGLHVTEIARQCGAHPRKLSRVLRLLATKHVFREVSDNVFANNRLSSQLYSSNPVSNIALHLTDECQRSAVLLSDTLSDAEWGHSLAPNQTAFNKWSEYSGPLFKFYEGATPQGAELGARFGVAMLGWAEAIEANAVIHDFPWAELGDGASVCDVGGGIGTMTMQLAKAYPTLNLKLQDLPERIVQAKEEVWPKECPEAIAEKRIEFKAIDFLTEPPIPGCKAYYLKNIVHDWPDDNVIQIYSQIRKAMDPDSILLVHEFILEHASTGHSDAIRINKAPPPLLPNFGNGRQIQYNVDIDMMVMLNSEERQLEDFIRLGNAAGLKFEKVWDFGHTAMVEYRL